MKIILDLLKPRSIFTFMFFYTFCDLIHKGIMPPDPLVKVVFALLGFWFVQRVIKKRG